jgi:hypothetical protein
MELLFLVFFCWQCHFKSVENISEIIKKKTFKRSTNLFWLPVGVLNMTGIFEKIHEKTNAQKIRLKLQLNPIQLG